MQIYNQSSGIECKARFYSDPNHASLARPNSVEWRLTDEETGEVLQDWTTAAITVELADEELTDCFALVEIPGPLNTCPTSRNYSLKRLTVAADRGQDREYSESTVYRVLRSR